MMKQYLVPCAGLLMLGGIGTASAQDALADDIPIMVDNLGATVEALGAGLGGVIDALTDPDEVSAVAISAAAGDMLVDSGSELVAGTETLGAMGLGFMLVNNGTQNALRPYLRVMDDPSDENIEQILNPDDLATIVGNLSGVPGTVFDGGFDGVRPAAVQVLRGDNFGFALLSGAGGVFLGYAELTEGTNYAFGTEGDPTGPLVAATLVAIVAGGDQLVEIQENLEPLYEATEDLREPAADALDAVDLDWLEPTLDPIVGAVAGEL